MFTGQLGTFESMLSYIEFGFAPSVVISKGYLYTGDTSYYQLVLSDMLNQDSMSITDVSLYELTSSDFS